MSRTEQHKGRGFSSARIATRNGKPAYLDAPPRLRASQIERVQPVERKPRWWPFNRKD